jgi:hypothetical protein
MERVKKTRFMFNNFFFYENSAINVENSGTVGKPTNDNRAHALLMLDN